MFTGGVDPVIEKRSVSGQQPRVEREHLIVSACGRTLGDDPRRRGAAVGTGRVMWVSWQAGSAM